MTKLHEPTDTRRIRWSYHGGDLLELASQAPLEAKAAVEMVEERTPKWVAMCLRRALAHLADIHPDGFTADDLTDEIRSACQPTGPEIGAAFRTARQAGIIVPTGQARESTRREAHGRVVRIWRAAA